MLIYIEMYRDIDKKLYDNTNDVGADVEELIEAAVREADYDVSLAERAIIVLDEGDKLARKSGEYAAADLDVSGEAVQQSLLKIIEGTEVEVSPSGRMGLQAEPLMVDTSNILFVINGSFEGIANIIKDRLNKHAIGFGEKQVDISDDEVLKHVQPQDLIKFGMIPELVGRSPVIVPLDTLTLENLKDIISKPKNCILQQYKTLFNMDKVNLQIEDGILQYIAELATKRKLNARGLRAIMEAILQPVAYQYPQEKGCTSVTITDDLDALIA